MLSPGQVIEDPSALPDGFAPATCPKQPPAAAVLMVSPRHYDVVYAINPHMMDSDGRPRTPDRLLAARQWDALRRTYESLGYPVEVLEGAEGLPDMVFAANQSFPFPRRGPGPPGVLLSRMRHPERAAEVAHLEQWYAARGFEIVPRAPGGTPPYLEGHGDLLWFPGRRLLFGGHGYRTELAALHEAARAAEAPLLALRLLQEGFYHLDTCLAPLDAGRALVVPPAFEDRGLELVARCFAKLLAVPAEEASGVLACNAHCPDGRNVVIDAGAKQTIRLLKEEGFRVHAVDTSEFLKAGGSVFCLKMMLPAR